MMRAPGVDVSTEVGIEKRTIGTRLPDGWEKTFLGEVAFPSRPRQKPADFPDLPFIGMEHVEAHTMRQIGEVPASTMKSSAVHFQPGDVLYGRLNPYLNKVLRARSEGLCSAEFIVFPEQPWLDSRFLQFLLHGSAFVTFASRLNEGDRPRVDYAQISPFQIWLPPLPEQRRIVEEIEKQLTRLDAAVAALERARANLKRYRAAVLKAACEGRLVPTEADLARAEGRDYETGEQLLARILTERRARWEADELAKMRAKGKEPKNDTWKAKYKEPPPVSDAQRRRVPNGWIWASFDQIVEFITSGSRGWARYYADDGPLFVRAQNLKTDLLELTDIAHVQLPDSAEGQRTKLEDSDLLVTITGANVTKSALVPAGLPEAYVSQHVALLRFVLPESASYAYYFTICPGLGRKALLEAAYGLGKPGLNLDDIKGLVVPLPPASEQHRIVTELRCQLSILAAIEASTATNLRRAQRLRQSILKRAFEGKLVPQDPNDEPASALLERIRAEAAPRAGMPSRGNLA